MRAPETLDPWPLGFCGVCVPLIPLPYREKVIFRSHKGIAPITTNLILLLWYTKDFPATGFRKKDAKTLFNRRLTDQFWGDTRITYHLVLVHVYYSCWTSNWDFQCGWDWKGIGSTQEETRSRFGFNLGCAVFLTLLLICIQPSYFYHSASVAQVWSLVTRG